MALLYNAPSNSIILGATPVKTPSLKYLTDPVKPVLQAEALQAH